MPSIPSLPSPGQLAGQVTSKLQTAWTLQRAGIITPTRPDRMFGLAIALIRLGATPAAGYTISALRYPDEPAVIDELGTLTFKEVHERSNALARALSEDGIGAGDGVGIMCRNHRGFIDAVVALSKLGADALFLNTSFSGPQLADVAERENPRALVYDSEFAELIKDAGRRRKRYVAWHEPDHKVRDPRLEELVEGGDTSNLPPPSERGRAIILTSGTTGTPKGASR